MLKEVSNIRDYTRRPENNRCIFSIVVPVLNEADQINAIIEHLANQDLRGDCEIIVVDGDSEGSTNKAIQNKSIKAITSQKGRSYQMNAGAEIACGEILIFLHADTRLPENALKKIGTGLENGKYVGGAFDLAIDSDRLFLKYISMRASFRSRSTRIPYGDQAIFIRKNYFDRIGRFKEIPLMEDVDLMRRIKKDGKKICILADKVVTSSRRWDSDGLIYTTVRNHILLGLFYLGVSPEKLARYYWRKPNGKKS